MESVTWVCWDEILLHQIDYDNEDHTALVQAPGLIILYCCLFLKTRGREALINIIIDWKGCNFLWYEILLQMDIKIYVW